VASPSNARNTSETLDDFRLATLIVHSFYLTAQCLNTECII